MAALPPEREGLEGHWLTWFKGGEKNYSMGVMRQEYFMNMQQSMTAGLQAALFTE